MAQNGRHRSAAEQAVQLAQEVLEMTDADIDDAIAWARKKRRR
jgi:hypothetical protein